MEQSVLSRASTVATMVTAAVLVQGAWLTPPAWAEARVVVIVELEDAPAATYDGTLRGLPATRPDMTGRARLDVASPDVKAYLAYLAQKQAAFEAEATNAIPDVRVLYRYRRTLNGLAIQVREDQVTTIARLPGVRAIHRDRRRGLSEERNHGRAD